MPRTAPSNATVFFSLGTSIFGLLTVLILAFTHTSTSFMNVPWQKLTVGSIFMTICALGAVAALFPRSCSGHYAKPAEKGKTKGPRLQLSPSVCGHHYDCGRFSAHVMLVGHHTVCAACTGLLSGALIAFCGAFLYFFLGWELMPLSYPFIFVGSVLVVLGFAELRFISYVRSLLNALFVVGAFLVFIGVDARLQNTLVDVYLIGLVVFWIWTRILLSERDHARTCLECTFDCQLKKEGVR